MGAVLDQLDGVGVRRVVEGRPTTAGLELSVAAEQLVSARPALEDAGPVLVEQRPGAGAVMSLGFLVGGLAGALAAGFLAAETRFTAPFLAADDDFFVGAIRPSPPEAGRRDVRCGTCGALPPA